MCHASNIKSATFTGIGTYLPAKKVFQKHTKRGMLEMVSLTGNVTLDTQQTALEIHAHSLFTYLKNNEIKTFGGDLKAAAIMYTGEITSDPVENGVITKRFDPVTGINVWNFR